MKSIFLILVILAAACTQQATTTTTTIDVRELPLEQSVEKMKEEMKTTPGDVSEEIVQEDQGFIGSAVKSGVFENLNYMSSGSASIVEKSGKYFLVLGDDFSTPNGPDLVVYLTKNSGPSTREDIVSGIQLEKLKSIKGMQVYELPEGININDYNSVTIHCRAFNVPWSYVPLK